MNDSEKAMAALGLIFFAVTWVALMPLAYIWGWNHLFGDIKTFDYTFWNWLAVILLGTFLRGFKIEKKKP